MQKEKYAEETFLNDLYAKYFLTDMKTRIIQLICSLVDDRMYTKEEAATALMEIVALIELEEKMIDTNKMKAHLLEG